MAQYPVKSEHKLIDYFYTDTNSRCETFPSQPFKPVCLLSAQTFKGMETIDQEHLADFTQNISKYNDVIINVFTWPPSLNKTTLFSIISHFFQNMADISQILAESVNLWAQLYRIFEQTNRRKCGFFLVSTVFLLLCWVFGRVSLLSVTCAAAVRPTCGTGSPASSKLSSVWLRAAVSMTTPPKHMFLLVDRPEEES